MNITNATREDIKTRYEITIEHDNKEYIWTYIVSEDEGSTDLYCVTDKQDIFTLPEWLDDYEFFELFENNFEEEASK